MAASVAKKTEKNKVSAQTLLRWYDKNRRDLPWRARQGQRPDPYYVWLSEIMLQQTTVPAVIPYFLKFIRRWPTLRLLAGASLDDINRLWAGLGYYSRARNLHACARRVVDAYDGALPEREEALLELPGIGPYTAAAIAAIAFDRKANVVDGNVERVVSRLFAVTDPLPKAKPLIRAHAAALLPEKRAGDYAQALMDLGATVCSPRSPKCGQCPWSGGCIAFQSGQAESFPRRIKKNPRPVRYGEVFVLSESGGRLLLQKRPDKGLLAGMMGFPGTDWTEKPLPRAESPEKRLIKADWRLLGESVHHVFTHFELVLGIRYAKIGPKKAEKVEGKWVRWQDCADEALPSVMKKVLTVVMREERKE